MRIGENNKLYKLNKNSADSGYKIQLSSAWSEKEAKNEWERIQIRHIKYLKNAQLVIKKVKTNNDRIIYLVMAGNYPSLNQAKLVCKKLVSSKQNCIVTK
jgi:septal ring-binding cell division protein DamX